ncbi:DUF3866 family protein [Evansella sp. AB-P1]|uniref:DUF3866 family protein n=1 Tax=Evansella sp. AB-P1 TaxID=3037653 RepID=UPI00241DF54B|nr:DUF3866 family protein [Evansella sp. AB-P1]MDG5787689.1 DUF3866 family protein [Evansella sp. AB-P1]
MLLEERVQVTEIIEETDEIIRMKTSGGIGKAILYRKLHPKVIPGDWVNVNITAAVLGLGTGGWDIVRSVVDKTMVGESVKKKHGHIMKPRYLSDQHSLLTVESPESKHHSLFQKKLMLEGRKVFLCELHSMLPIVYFLMKIIKEKEPLVVIFSDEASLPLAMSRHLSYLNKQSSFFSISTGQAFGAQEESINIVTALQYINEVFGEGMVLITLGPGVVGSNSHYGYSGLAQGNWANMVGALGGKPVWIPRMSGADSRERHQGISHHTLTPLTELTLTESVVPIPVGNYSDKWLKESRDFLSEIDYIDLQTISEEKLTPYLEEVQRLSPFPLTSMGRTIDKDPLFFLGIAAAVQWYFDSEHHSCKV